MKIYIVAGITQDNYIIDDSSHIEYVDANKRISELEEECNGTQWEIMTIDVPDRDSCYIVTRYFDDELSSPPHFTPLVYFDKNKAQKKCDKLNLERPEYSGYIFIVEHGNIENT